MHIMATDDEQSALNVLMGAVREAVPLATVHGFRNPLEALEFMKETKCEIAFLDIQMREMSGIVLARKLKEIYPKVNIVFVTGYSQYANEAFALHASGYVYKPVTVDKVLVEMENLRNPVKWEDTGIFVNTFGSLYVTSIGTETGKDMTIHNNDLYTIRTKYDNDLWYRRYPEVYCISDNEPLKPVDNMFTENLLVNSGYQNIDVIAKSVLYNKNNISYDKDEAENAGFYDYVNKDYRLMDNAEVFEKIKGFYHPSQDITGVR